MKCKNKAITLWAIADMFRTDRTNDQDLEAIGQMCDKAAIRYATEAGTTYDELREAVKTCTIETAYETITQ